MDLRLSHSVSILLATTLLAGAGFAAQSAATALQAEAEVVEVAPLELALDSISADNIRSDIHFLASDIMGGRDTPSEGQRIAARFIRARLERLGWDPGTADGYLHTYEMPWQALDPEGTTAAFSKEGGTHALALGVDYAFSSRSMDLELKGGIVYAGSFAEDEIEGLDLKGKWALVESPKDVNPWILRRNAGRIKAAGLILVPGEGKTEQEMAKEVESLAERAVEGRLSRGGGRRGFPTTYLTQKSYAALLEFAGNPKLDVGAELGVELHEVRKTKDSESVQLENVCGLWKGSDPTLANEVIILSAHYDHVGIDSSGDVFNGADDNGSGTTGLLQLAEALTHYGPMRRTVMLIWVSGEEKGLLGSKAWTEDPWLPEGMKPFCNVNIDMIGRNAPDSLLITPTKEHKSYNGLTRIAERNRAMEGFGELKSADEYWSRSDHASFSQNLEIPVAFLFSDVHEDYHKVTDTADKIDYDKIRRVVRLVLRMLSDLQASEVEL